MKSLLICIAIFFNCTLISAQKTGTFTDTRDGKTYQTVKIGNQTWMAENLNFKSEKGSWCYDNQQSNCNIYGRLYTMKTSKIVCPIGWHLPSLKEWSVLNEYLGGKKCAGGKLKEKGAAHWMSPNKCAETTSGFNALPGGWRPQPNNFNSIGEYGFWWSSDVDNERQYGIYFNQDEDFNYNWWDGVYDLYENVSMSVRCLKE